MTSVPSDRADTIAWTIIKVIISLIRFWFGAMCCLICLGSLLSLATPYGGGSTLNLWHAFLFAFLAFIIWPQRYGPPTKLIEMYSLRSRDRKNDTND